MIRARTVLLLALFLLSAAAVSAQTAWPRPEYPRPDFVRADWLNLNGTWDFALDLSNSGEERGMALGGGFDRKIVVPFAPESPLSGIGHLDFMNAVWYKRRIQIPPSWQGRRIFLNFEAVDYRTTVWINGQKAGEHQGGYTPFSLDITDLLQPGENLLVVRAQDDVRSGLQPAGKQSTDFASAGCMYRRTTGIWQTVWLEPLPDLRIERYKVTTDVDNGEANVHVYLNRAPEGGTIALKVTDGGRPVASLSKAAGRVVRFTVKIKDPKLWDVRRPNLYDFEISLERDGRAADKAAGYFGMRKVETRGQRFYLNNRPLFLRTVLDQGFYPDGIYTAPTDEALKKDIELSQSFGFDGARLHQRVFERRYLHWADRLGYLVWGEYADWGIDLARPEAYFIFAREWSEAVQRDLTHPAIIGWCPFNERGEPAFPGAVAGLIDLTRLLDPSRLVIDDSGGKHFISPDLYDYHDYEQDPVKLKALFDGLLAVPPVVPVAGGPRPNVAYAGQPYFVSEYGGIWWNPEAKDDKAWGYGSRPRSEAEYLERYRRLTEVLLDNPSVAGFCYTQLTDVEQEVNGLCTFGRKPKFDPAVIRAINQRKAAIEK